MTRPSARAINAVHCVECGHRWEPAGGAQGQTLPSCPLCALRLERDRAVELLRRFVFLRDDSPAGDEWYSLCDDVDAFLPQEPPK